MIHSPPASESDHQSPCIVVPVYNDWTALDVLLPLLDDALRSAGLRARLLIVDDGSTALQHIEWSERRFQAVESVDILELRRNLGHQRAIAVGLAYLEAHIPTQTIVIMDGDGEDTPTDVPKLLERYEAGNRQSIVFAERRRRSESVTFRALYALYRCLHLLLTGHRVRVGNFSVLPRHLLYRLVVVSELWSHYAAAVFKARLPHVAVPTTRAKRLGGRSSMSYVSLVVHGMSAISVYSDVVGVRALVASLALALLSAAAITVVFVVRVFTTLAIPGWATLTTGILLVILLQVTIVSLLFSFTILANRQGFLFVPTRDYGHFVDRLAHVYPTR